MKKILGILAGAALLTATPAHATNGMRMIGFGPVQNSMGGASVAAPLDGVTAATNPAGLSALGQRFDLAAQAFMPSVKYSMSMPGFSAGQSSDRPTDFLPTVAGVYRVQDQLTLGFAVLGTAGMGVDYAGVPNGGGGTDRLLSSYLNGRVAPAAAYKLNDQLSVGVALNLMYAQMSFQSGGDPKYGPASSFGYGATVGVTYTPASIVTFGVAYETKSFFQDFEDSPGGMKTKVALDQPMVATVGAGVRPAAGLLLALDLQWINWSDVMGTNKPVVTTPMGAGSFDMKWKDQYVVKVGAQYAIPSVDALKVRLGYNYGGMPLDKSNYQANMMFPAVSEHHVTVGAGYDVGKLTLNAAVVYSPEASAKFTDPAAGNMTIESKMSQLAFELGGAYRF
jgi:long-chain fatty acid transport protein